MQPKDFSRSIHYVYRQIVSSIGEPDVRRVALVMMDHIGEANMISLEELARHCFGAFNASTERKTRKILELLATEHRMPVGAYSGRSGRWLCADEEERQRVVADLEARLGALTARVKALRTAIVPAQEPRFAEREVQFSLWR